MLYIIFHYGLEPIIILRIIIGFEAILEKTIFRRQIQDEVVKKPKHDFFDPNNREAKAIREACMEVK